MDSPHHVACRMTRSLGPVPEVRSPVPWHGYGLVREAPRWGAEAAPPDGFALEPAANGQSGGIEAGRQACQRERGQHEAEVS